jgi:calcium/proton exchanger cax
VQRRATALWPAARNWRALAWACKARYRLGHGLRPSAACPAIPGAALHRRCAGRLVFLTSAAAIAVLADWLRRATEQLARRAGSTIGSLLNVSFGNAAELMLALFILRQANIRVAQAQITGSIIGTTLLFLGISALVGGIGRTRQIFNQASASLLSTMLFLVVIAILLPAVFDLTERITTPGADISLIDERLSLGVSVVLLLTYAAGLVHTLFTHRDVFAGDVPSGQVGWNVARALAGREPTRHGCLLDDPFAPRAVVRSTTGRRLDCPDARG